MSDELIMAVSNGDIKKVVELLSSGADVNVTNKNNETPLHLAAWKGYAEIASLLLKHGANVNAQNYVADTPLHMAAWYGRAQVAKLLLDYGADVNARNRFGWTPLHYAVMRGHAKVVEILIKYGADVNAVSNVDATSNDFFFLLQKQTPLHYAASDGRAKITKLLIKSGADVNAKDGRGDTPLLYAADGEHTEVARLLLKHGADVDVSDIPGAKTGKDLAKVLKIIIKGERKTELEGIGKDIVKGTVESVSDDLATIHCSPPLFEEGDVIEQVGSRKPRRLGVVIMGGEHALVKLFRNNEVKEGKKLLLREAEQLLAYDLQLELIEKYLSEKLTEAERRVFNVFFENSFRIGDKKVVASSYKTLSMGGKEGIYELDEFQRETVERILGLQEGELLLIVGPPGTGKTSVIARAALELARHGEKVLIASHTNRAVDNVVELLPIEITLRVGRPEKVHENVRQYMLSYKARQALGKKLEKLEDEIKELKHERLKLKSKLRKLQKEHTSDGSNASSTTKILLERTEAKLRELTKERNELLKKESERLVGEARIIGSTLVKCGLWPLASQEFDIVIIDEASQATITLALLGMTKAKKWVLVGDHYQLPPVFKLLEKAVEQPEAVDPLSAFNRLIRLAGDGKAVWLRMHYRSNTALIGFASKHIYKGNIVPHSECERIKLEITPHGFLSQILDPEKPAVFVHVDGHEEAEGWSRWNPKEVEATKTIVRRLLELGVPKEAIGVISPYRAQRSRLSEALGEGIEVATVDAFQGREKDVIVFTATATEATSVLFAESPRRLNVALTRARKKLIVLANAEAPWNGLMHNYIEYVKSLGAYFSWSDHTQQTTLLESRF
jgi:energy-coupling factor transporter ATP-binding protein EcfA2